MKYKIIWSAFAEQQLDDIFSYYEQKTENYDIALKIVTKILAAPDKLIHGPRIGQR